MPPTSLRLKDRHSGNEIFLTIRDGVVVGAMGSDPKRFMGMTVETARHVARYGGSGAPKKARKKAPKLPKVTKATAPLARSGRAGMPTHIRVFSTGAYIEFRPTIGGFAARAVNPSGTVDNWIYFGPTLPDDARRI